MKWLEIHEWAWDGNWSFDVYLLLSKIPINLAWPLPKLAWPLKIVMMHSSSHSTVSFYFLSINFSAFFSLPLLGRGCSSQPIPEMMHGVWFSMPSSCGFHHSQRMAVFFRLKLCSSRPSTISFLWHPFPIMENSPLAWVTQPCVSKPSLLLARAVGWVLSTKPDEGQPSKQPRSVSSDEKKLDNLQNTIVLIRFC